MSSGTAQSAVEVDAKTLRRAVVAAAIGNAMEWFDFGVFSFVVAYVGSAFFPKGNATIHILEGFLTFAVAFLTRPFGGFIFGPLGDKIGRHKVLAATILIMAGSTFLVGVLPTYATAGLLAPVLLVLVRLIQGFATGGEYGGAATFMVEYAPARRRGYYCSWLAFGTLAGFCFGAGLVTLLAFYLSHGAMQTWGWRVPFLVALPLGGVGLYLRFKLEDTPAYQEAEQEDDVSKSPLKESFTQHWRELLIVMGVVLLLNVADYAIVTYLPESYLQETLGFSEHVGDLLAIFIQVVMMVLVVPIGTLTDRISGKTVLKIACVGFLLLSYPALELIASGDVVATIAGLTILGLLLVLMLGSQPSVLPAQFPTRVRYGGFAMAYSISTSAFGGTAPAAIDWLVDKTGDSAVPAYYLMAAAAIALVPIWMMRQTHRRSLQGIDLDMRRERELEMAGVPAEG